MINKAIEERRGAKEGKKEQGQSEGEWRESIISMRVIAGGGGETTGGRGYSALLPFFSLSLFIFSFFSVHRIIHLLISFDYYLLI